MSSPDFTHDTAFAPVEKPVGTPHDSVYVYETAVRYWHWGNAFCIATLIVTGYLIGNPVLSLPGEASSSFLFGYVRFAHFTAGLLLTVLFFWRIYWAFVGNVFARQIFLPPPFNKKWLHEFIYEMKWYTFLVRWPKKYIGHNPLAQFCMLFLLVIPLVFMIFSGLALYAEGLGVNHPLYAVTKLALWLFGNSFTLHTWHHFGMWIIVTFVIVHIYTALREEVMSLQSMISAMTSGFRYFRNDDGS